MFQTLFAVWLPVHYADRNPGVSDLIGNEQSKRSLLADGGRIHGQLFLC